MTQNAELIAAWRAEQSPSVAERARVWEGIAARAELADPVTDEVAATRVVAQSIVRPRYVVAAMVLAAAAALVLVTAPRGHEVARTVEPALQQSIRAVLPAPELRSAVPQRAVEAPVAAPASIDEAPAPPPVDADAPRPSRRTKARRAPSIDPAEVALLERAQHTRDPLAALALFDQHARDYPRSALSAERELGRADARCRSGDVDGARALVDRFARTRPGSPLLARMRSICATP
jgi:hypothetical protein